MNDFKFLGTITHILPLEKGTSKAGKEWQKLQFVVQEEKAEYPQSMVFTMMDVKKIENFEKYQNVGDAVEVSFNLKAREYNGKWYADVTAWSVSGGKREAKTSTPQRKQEPVNAEQIDDDLPF